MRIYVWGKSLLVSCMYRNKSGLRLLFQPQPCESQLRIFLWALSRRFVAQEETSNRHQCGSFRYLGGLEPLQDSEAAANPMTTASLPSDTCKMQARQTHFILTTSTSEAALHIIRSVAGRCGFDARRRMRWRYEPAVGNKSLALLRKGNGTRPARRRVY